MIAPFVLKYTFSRKSRKIVSLDNLPHSLFVLNAFTPQCSLRHSFVPNRFYLHSFDGDIVDDNAFNVRICAEITESRTLTRVTSSIQAIFKFCFRHPVRHCQCIHRAEFQLFRNFTHSGTRSGIVNYLQGLDSDYLVRFHSLIALTR